MKIAIAVQNGSVSEHFGHCEGFAVFDTDSKEIKSKQFLQSPEHEPGALPVFLKNHGVNVIIAGGMGERAQNLFASSGIATVVGASGKIEDAVTSYLAGELKSTDSICNEHSHAGECGQH